MNYDVIIVGGGPTGVALGMELGLHNIHTLILEKHAASLLSPRAQHINARSMELAMRWGMDEELKANQISSKDFPNQSVWCSKLNGITFATSNSNDQFNQDISSQRGIRTPLWVTEELLRKKITPFSCIHFLKPAEVLNIIANQEEIIVEVKNNNQVNQFKSSYVVACDGANSVTRNTLGIPFESLAPEKRVISVMFEAPELGEKITITKGCLFYILENYLSSAIGSINPEKGFWYAQILYDGKEELIEQVDVRKLLDDIAGFHFNKKIMNAHFWSMHLRCAKQFSYHDRVFLVGDSAHAFVPTGGFGLNTGFGDVVNLGWKLAAVINHQAKNSLLETYEAERRPICLRNMEAAQQNANDMMSLRNRVNPKENMDEFAKASAALAKQFTHSLGLTMGYAYFNSPLISFQKNQSTLPMQSAIYEPTALPGYFLPHIWLDSTRSIYHALSKTHWTLIISGESDSSVVQTIQNKFAQHHLKLEILTLKEGAYSSKYMIIRPDWHIAWVGNELTDHYIHACLELFYS